MKGLKRFLLLLAAAVLGFVVLGWDYRLKTAVYTVESTEIDAPVRIACLADLHSCHYGADQRELLDTIDAAAPDLVVLVGDIYDDVLPPDNTTQVLTHLAERYPCFYVTGNHDRDRGDTVASLGITVLDGSSAEITANGQPIRLWGIGDPLTHGTGTFNRQLEAMNAENAGQKGFSLLLSHRPERIGQYLPGGYDLILSGHAHGGQWRIPGLLNGLLAPGQGFFPKYAGGRYDLDGTAFVVSRGLAKESTRAPRLYNPPELIIVDLQ